MATITEDYINFETAKLLKEKGFDEPCHACYAYFSDDDIRVFDLKYSKATQSLNENRYPYVSIYVAMKWLREAHNLFIMIDCGVGAYVWSIADMSNGDVILKVDAVVGSYEQTCEAAIKYCLKNLI